MLAVRIVIVLVLVAGGIAFLRAAWRTVRMARISQRWPEVPAEITASGMKLIGFYRTYRLRENFLVEISYAYAVFGAWYSGHRYRWTIWRFGGMTREEALETIGRYPAGSHVTARYDPDRPAESVLEPRADWMAVATCVMFGALALFTAVYLPLSETDVLPAWLD